MNELDDEMSDEEVDPRVKEELEALNAASVEINKLETELDKARTKFKTLLSESSSRLNALYKKLGKAVDKARPYHEQLKETKKAEQELQRATVSFQRANSLYKAARETVELAEQRKVEKTWDDAQRPEFDSAWQEMMNHATLKFTQAKKERAEAEESHGRCARAFAEVQRKLHFYEKDIPRTISRSRPYFELKDHLETRLQQERQSVEDLQRALAAAKELYRSSLSSLENISEEIHAARQLRHGPRTPGVGAEAADQTDLETLSINLDTQSVKSALYLDDADVVSLCSQDVNFAISCSTAGELGASHPLACSDVKTSAVTAKQLASPRHSHHRSASQGAIPKHFSPVLVPISDVTSESDHVTVTVDQSALTVGTATAVDQSKSSSATQKSESQNEGSKKTANPASVGVVHSDTKPHSVTSTQQHSNTTLAESRGPTKASEKNRVRSEQSRADPSQFPMLQGLMETSKQLSGQGGNNMRQGSNPRGQGAPRDSASPVRRNVDGYYEFPVVGDRSGTKVKDSGSNLSLGQNSHVKQQQTPPVETREVYGSESNTTTADQQGSNAAKTTNNANNGTNSKQNLDPQTEKTVAQAAPVVDSKADLIDNTAIDKMSQLTLETSTRNPPADWGVEASRKEVSDVTKIESYGTKHAESRMSSCDLDKGSECQGHDSPRGEGEGRESEEEKVVPL